MELYLRSMIFLIAWVWRVFLSFMVALDTYRNDVWREYRALNSKQYSNHGSFVDEVDSNAWVEQ